MISFGTQQLNTIATYYRNAIGLFFDSRISLINAFIMLIPFWSLIMISDVLGRTRSRSRYLLQQFNQFFIAGLTINVTYNTYYFCTKSIQTFQGRMHLVAALCCLIFIIYLSFNFRSTADARYGLIVSYLGVSLSLFTLPLEYFFEENKIFRIIFFVGFGVYFFGLILTAASVKATRFMLRLRHR